MRELTRTGGVFGAILDIMLFAFHIFITRKELWYSLEARINYDYIAIIVSVVSLGLLMISMILDENAD